MLKMEEFIEHYKHYTAVERAWLCEVYTGVCDWLHPVVGVSLGVSGEQLAHAVVLRLQRTHHCLPVSYRFLSVAQLISTQRTSCFSSLTWSTSQHREWTRKVEPHLPNHKALPRTNLILTGLLCDGRVSAQCDGFWRVRDSSGSVHCEVLSSSPLWLRRLMLFPTWNYISHTAPGLGQQTEGCLELIDSPICVTPDLTTFDPRGSLSDVIGVKKAARLLRQTSSRGVCISVYGEVCVICPLLVISGKSFFCLVLSEGDSTVPVLVTVPECVYWRQCVCVGQNVCISALRVCSVRGWSGHRVLSVTAESRLHPNSKTYGESEDTDSHLETHTDTHEETDTQAQSCIDTHTDTDLQQETECEEAQVQDGPVRTKLSKIISYRGRITEVQAAEAGLYELDGKILLCLAYQPLRKWDGSLRLGAEIELYNIHFLFRPSPLTPDVVLCACLRSSVSVTTFSPLRPKVTQQRSDSPLVRFLLEKNLGVSEYLWLCYCYAALTDRLCPRWVCEARVCVVAGRLLQVILGDKETKKDKRDIYKEMLQDTHICPLTQYHVSHPSSSLYSVKKLCDWLEKESWACLSLSSLLPSSACHMTRAQLNPLLSWSAHTQTLVHTDTVLVGVLELSVDRATVRLVDQTAAIDCVCVESSTSEQCGSINTAWVGCLVCVRRCMLVMERFMETNFPSWKHLDQHRYITHKHCRVYICVCVDDLHILSPSTAMTSLIRESENGQETERPKKRKRKEEGWTNEEKSCLHHKLPQRIKASSERREEKGDGAMEVDECIVGPSQSNRRRETEGTSAEFCVSLLFCVDTKQGVAFRNVQSTNEAHALTLSFVVKATCLGDVQVWERDPRNSRVEERETKGAEITMELQFMDSAVRWFPLLQPGTIYRLVALHTQDVAVLSCSCVPVRGGVSLLSNPTLFIQPKWRIHTLTPPLLLSQPEIQRLMSVSEVLHASSADVVSFYGVISERITLPEETSKIPTIQSLISTKDDVMETGLHVRLTLQDVESSHHTLQVYLDFTHNPYTPGLIAGATVRLHHFQRKVSVCVTVAGLGSVKPYPPPPTMHLSEWASVRAEHGILCQIRGHVVCVLSLWLQWTCSFCGSVFRQAACTRLCQPCDSTSAVFQAEAKVVVEDGTGEAQVWFPTESLANLLLLSKSEWEGLQRLVRVKGHVRTYTRGRSMVCDVDPDDPLVMYLCCVCSSSAVCRHVTLVCKLRSHKPEKAQLRKVSRGDREFLTKFTKPLQLQCTHIHTLT
ncbi:CST complex subunit CTC1 isoform X2 [Neoarius graeffei]|uniref:CST complex subunit CTC1 isoform X2 n=1 Tax=Neoarius graeffei TaxID=443677 RepID=UPI00298C539B|nr:CST complex subunit CTC1 isoform X2 [Neoarius graeffei]